MDFNNKCIIAITGPTAAGKTTLGNLLSMRNGVLIPRHVTTRLKRNDDKEGFYRYLRHDEYRKLLEEGKFLISSGDGPVVSEEYGNFYGVLKSDCVDAWKCSNVIILFVSYKDIKQLIELKVNGLDIDIVNLTFTEIENGIIERLTNDSFRNHTEQDIKSRIKNAILDNEKYGNALQMYAKTMIYTDLLSIEQTYQKVCKDLGLRRVYEQK